MITAGGPWLGCKGGEGGGGVNTKQVDMKRLQAASKCDEKDSWESGFSETSHLIQEQQLFKHLWGFYVLGLQVYITMPDKTIYLSFIS